MRVCKLADGGNMQQTESSKLTLEDKRELELHIKELSLKIENNEKKRIQMMKHLDTHFDECVLLVAEQMNDTKELRRLRRMRS